MPSLVDELRALAVESVILDGEVIGVTEDGLPDAFQDSASTFGRQTGARHRSRWTRRGSTSCTSTVVDLHRRTAARHDSTAMDAIAGPAPHPVGPYRRRATVAQRLLDDALATGHEGVMVKALTSTVRRGTARQGRGARSSRSTPSTWSCSAVEWGSGRRRGWLSNLHLGALGRRRRPGDGRQDLQGPHRRAARVADGAVPRARDPPRRARRLRPAGAGRRDRARRGAGLDRAIPAAWRCASPGCGDTGTTRRPPTPTRSTPSGPCSPRPPLTPTEERTRLPPGRHRPPRSQFRAPSELDSLRAPTGPLASEFGEGRRPVRGGRWPDPRRQQRWRWPVRRPHRRSLGRSTVGPAPGPPT